MKQVKEGGSMQLPHLNSCLHSYNASVAKQIEMDHIFCMNTVFDRMFIFL